MHHIKLFLLWQGKIYFGILLRYDDGNKEDAGSLIQVGEEVYPVADLL